MKHLLLSFLFFSIQPVFGNWSWVQSANSTDGESCEKVAVDANGNVLMGGYFMGDSLDLHGVLLLNPGSSEAIYIAKYDSSGNVLWANAYGNDDYLGITALTTDFSGNIFFGGYFYDTILVIGQDTLRNNAHDDVAFVSKLDPNGNSIWSKASISESRTRDIEVNQLGEIFFSGSFMRANFIWEDTLQNAGPVTTSDAFIIKLTSSGFQDWIKHYSTSANDIAPDICIDNSNNIYATIGRDTFPNNIVQVTKLDAIGNTIWTTDVFFHFGMSYTNTDIDLSGNVYVSGFFNGSIIFNSQTYYNTGGGFRDGYILSVSNSGLPRWVKTFGSIYNEEPTGLAVEGDKVYVTGAFNGNSIVIGGLSQLNTQIMSTDAFVALFDTLGNVKMLTSFGGKQFEIPYSIASDNFGNLIIGGTYESDTLTIGSTSLFLLGSSDIFLSKYRNIATGISDIMKNEISAYPVPATKFLNISGIESPFEYKISNTTGLIVLNGITIKTISLENLSPGLYFLEINLDKSQIVKRILIIPAF